MKYECPELSGFKKATNNDLANALLAAIVFFLIFLIVLLIL
jgi:hypothetical protein